jgi:hypothetical protein
VSFLVRDHSISILIHRALLSDLQLRRRQEDRLTITTTGALTGLTLTTSLNPTARVKTTFSVVLKQKANGSSGSNPILAPTLAGPPTQQENAKIHVFNMHQRLFCGTAGQCLAVSNLSVVPIAGDIANDIPRFRLPCDNDLVSMIQRYSFS